MKVNGEAVRAEPRRGYVHLLRDWREGDAIDLELEMTPVYVRANPRIREDAGKAALQRGPIVYCLEEADNGAALHALRALGSERFAEVPDAEVIWSPHLLGGVTAITTPGLRDSDTDNGDADDDAPLYTDDDPAEPTPTRLRWIPYYAWANRGLGEMRVWVRR